MNPDQSHWSIPLNWTFSPCSDCLMCVTLKEHTNFGNRNQSPLISINHERALASHRDYPRLYAWMIYINLHMRLFDNLCEVGIHFIMWSYNPVSCWISRIKSEALASSSLSTRLRYVIPCLIESRDLINISMFYQIEHGHAFHSIIAHHRAQRVFISCSTGRDTFPSWSISSNIMMAQD